MMCSVKRSNSSESRRRPSGSWVRRSFLIRISSSKDDGDREKGSLPSKFIAEVIINGGTGTVSKMEMLYIYIYLYYIYELVKHI